MTPDELREFLTQRRPSPHTRQFFDASGLACYGCAHSAASEPPPGKPSGERPCATCVRNPEREQWRADAARRRDPPGSEPIIQVDDLGNGRIFDAFAGAMYNGAPRLYDPMDNYVTLDQRDQDEWLEAHPEYKLAIGFRDGRPVVAQPQEDA